MFHKILNAIMRMLGWSSVGKSVLLVSGEGPCSACLAGASGVISEVRSERYGQEVIQVTLNKSILINGISLSEIFLVPRHRGYGASALAITSIATYVVGEIEAVNGPLASENDILAMMDVRVT